MGFKPGKSFASPGITYSEGGTVATVDPSAAITVPGKPGVLEDADLSAAEVQGRPKRLFTNWGSVASTTTSHSSGSVLATLERKYLGAAA